MWEIEMDRMGFANGPQEEGSETPDVFEQSIKILNAARKQIIGY
jgi:hypothetical protein